jgi:hypothetical protein
MAVLALGSGIAQAGCHLIDCVEEVRLKRAELAPLSCETLWILRNSIYKDYGYCFKTARAVAWFGNQGCRWTTASAVPLSLEQRHNVDPIKQVETAKGC